MKCGGSNDPPKTTIVLTWRGSFSGVIGASVRPESLRPDERDFVAFAALGALRAITGCYARARDTPATSRLAHRIVFRWCGQ